MNQNKVVAATAFSIGLTPLIPIPIIDEFVRTWLLRRGIAQVAQAQGVSLSKADINHLAGDGKSCLVGCFVGLFWWPIRKLFRTMFYFLTIKECLDNLVQGAVRIEMVRRAIETNALPARPDRVRNAMLQAMDADLRSPVFGMIRHRGAPGHIELEGGSSVRMVYWLVDASDGVAACDGFSERIERYMSMEE